MKIEFVNEVNIQLVEVSASDEMVAMAAWVSNDRDSEDRLGDKKALAGLINFLYRNRHNSPFEHGHFTFKADVPLSVAREWHRHRTMSYNEVSGRYTEMKPRFYAAGEARVQQGKMGNYYFVPGTEEQTRLYWDNKMDSIGVVWKNYQDNLAAGIAKEQAREELPLSLMTQFYATCSPRNLMQFLQLRNDKHALKEIRDAAIQMEAIFAETMPLTYSAFKQFDYRKDKEELDILRKKVSQMEAEETYRDNITASGALSVLRNVGSAGSVSRLCDNA